MATHRASMAQRQVSDTEFYQQLVDELREADERIHAMVERCETRARRARMVAVTRPRMATLDEMLEEARS